MKLKIFKKIVIFIIFISLFSCEKFLETPLPSDKIFAEQMFTSDKTIAVAVNGAYATVALDVPTLNNLGVDTGIYSDELTLNDNTTNKQQQPLYLDKLSANTPNSSRYTDLYKLLYQANALIEGISASTAKLEHRDQYLGESYFLRALTFYNLTNVYGDIAMPLTTNFDVNNHLTRIPQKEVVSQIIVDLKKAVDKLPATYVTSSGEKTTEKTRPNKIAAKALLAKVYLGTQNWKEAQDLCKEVLAEVTSPSLIDLDQVFKINSDAIIWCFPSNLDTQTGYYKGVFDRYLYLGSWYNEYFASFSNAKAYLSKSLLDAFETGDQRLVKWVYTYKDPDSGNIFKFPYKYQSQVTGEESFALLRMADIYLTRAEALANQDKIPEAIADINEVRKRAGLKGTTATGKEAVLNAILAERRVEYFCELSSRFFDLKRMGKIDQVMTAEVEVKGNGAVWMPYKQFWPLSISEMLANPKLKQTTGY